MPTNSHLTNLKKFAVNQKILPDAVSSCHSYEYTFDGGHVVKKLVKRDNRCQIKTDGINSLGFGKIHVRKGTRPQSYFKSPQPAFDIYNNVPEVFEHYEVDLNKSVTVGGCFDTNKHTLQRTAIPEIKMKIESELPTFLDFIKFREYIIDIVIKLKIEQIEEPEFEDCLMSHFKSDSNPGFIQSMINNFKNKSSSFKTSSYAAKAIFEQLDKISIEGEGDLVGKFITDKPKSKGLYVVGARNKRDYTYTDGEVAVSRAVHMPEFHNEISVSAWIDRINDSLHVRDNGPIYVGNSIATYERYQRDIQNNKSFVEGDWKRYDSSYKIMSLIVCACICRLYYPYDSSKADVHFFWIFYLHLIKDYYLPGGNVVRILNGLPSGTKCTSVWNSIYNLFALRYCCKHVKSCDLNFAVGGDDFVIMFRKMIADDAVEKIQEASLDLGMTFKFCVKKKPDSKNISELPYFYKYSVKDGVPVLSPATLMERLYCPQKKAFRSNIQYLQFLDAQIPALGYPSTTHLLFYSLYKSVYNRVYNDNLGFSNSRMSIKDVFKMHVQSYDSFRYNYKRRTSIDQSILHFDNLSCSNDAMTNKDITIVNKILCDATKVTVLKYSCLEE